MLIDFNGVKMIPIAKPVLDDDEKNAVADVFNSGIFVQGPKVEQFEIEFSKFIGARHGIATSSGTTALAVSLTAMGIKKGDEVITSPFTFIATATSIRSCGATPVFVDVDPLTFNISPGLIEAAVTTETKAIMPVHLYGLTSDMAAIGSVAEQNGLKIIEDACQAHGARFEDKMAGAMGDSGCFSFYPTKNMTTGEGGMITTNDEALAHDCRLIRNHGQEARYQYAMLGYNHRMTEFAGAMGIVQLKKLAGFNQRRSENAKLLSELLDGIVETPVIPQNRHHVFHQYTIKLDTGEQRNKLKTYLFEKGISSEVYYPIGLHQIEFLNGKISGSLENTEKLTETVLSLPVHPGVSRGDIELIAKEVKAGLNQ